MISDWTYVTNAGDIDLTVPLRPTRPAGDAVLCAVDMAWLREVTSVWRGLVVAQSSSAPAPASAAMPPGPSFAWTFHGDDGQGQWDAQGIWANMYFLKQNADNYPARRPALAAADWSPVSFGSLPSVPSVPAPLLAGTVADMFGFVAPVRGLDCGSHSPPSVPCSTSYSHSGHDSALSGPASDRCLYMWSWASVYYPPESRLSDYTGNATRTDSALDFSFAVSVPGAKPAWFAAGYADLEVAVWRDASDGTYSSGTATVSGAAAAEVTSDGVATVTVSSSAAASAVAAAKDATGVQDPPFRQSSYGSLSASLEADLVSVAVRLPFASDFRHP